MNSRVANMTNIHTCSTQCGFDRLRCTCHEPPTSPSRYSYDWWHRYPLPIRVDVVRIGDGIDIPLIRNIILIVPVPASLSRVTGLETDLADRTGVGGVRGTDVTRTIVAVALA